MIEIISGVPGAGKSYYAVKRINDLLKQSGKFLILHNIEALNIDDARLRSCDFTPESFKYSSFANYIPRLRKEYGLPDDVTIYCFIDEAQRFFPPELKDNETVYLFDYHRHLGLDFILITQSVYKISRKISTLSGQEVRAVNPKINPVGGFVYKRLAAGEEYGKFRIKKDKNIFSLYKSFDAGSGKVKTDRRLQFVIVGFVCVVLIAGYFFFNSGIFAVDAPDSQAAQRKNKRLDAALYDNKKPSQSGQPAGSVLSSSRIKKNETVSRCRPVSPALPIPEDYFPDTDRVQISKNGRTVQIPVSRYLKNYRPINYGYGVMHSPHDRLIIMSEDGRKVLFPEDYADFLNSRPGSPNRQNRFLGLGD